MADYAARLRPHRSLAGAHVVTIDSERHHEALDVVLSNSTRLTVDHVVLACGYRVDLGRVPYLRGLVEHIELADGFTVLDESFQTSLEGLYITGFSATKDFGRSSDSSRDPRPRPR